MIARTHRNPVVFAFLAMVLLLAALPAKAGLVVEGSGSGAGTASSMNAGSDAISIPSSFDISFGGRKLILHVPKNLQTSMPALVVVLHGGGGNADRVESKANEQPLNMDDLADRYGFIVAYLNGTQAMRIGPNMHAWNAGGGCCGQPSTQNVDDVTYIRSAIGFLVAKYNIDPQRIFGMGHSNGGMMTERVMCEAGVYAAGVSVSGPLNLNTTACPGAAGRKILAIHGSEDENVPVVGGKGKGPGGGPYHTEDYASAAFAGSGGSYTIDIVKGAPHKIDDIDRLMRTTEGIALQDRAAQFFGLMPGAK